MEIAFGTLIFLLAALAVALGFEVINGFHDTANAKDSAALGYLPLPPGVAQRVLQRVNAIGRTLVNNMINLRTDFHRRIRGQRHQQHEVHDERSPDRRHPGWSDH